MDILNSNNSLMGLSTDIKTIQTNKFYFDSMFSALFGCCKSVVCTVKIFGVPVFIFSVIQFEYYTCHMNEFY